MTMKLALIRAAVALGVLFGTSSAFAQCGASIPGGTICGNRTGAQGLNGPLTNPLLGIPGMSTGQIGFAGSGSGTATIAAQSAAGSPTLLLPNTSGTLPSTAASPLVLNATTGQLTCPTCLTGSGGALTASAPLNITGNNISLQGASGTIAQGSGGTGSVFTATPALGVAGSVLGMLSFANLTSGGIALQPATGALGSSVLTLPAVTDTLAGKALANGGTNASLTASNGGIVWSNATQFQILGGTATARQMLQSGSTATPAWSTATWPATTAAGTVLASSAANIVGATSTPTLGVAGSALGTLTFDNVTSGGITLSPPTGALGTVTNTLQAVNDTFVYQSTTDTLTNKTLTSPTINSGALSGTFTGAPTLSGNLTFSGVPNYTGLSSGTCVNGIALNASNNAIKAACPGAATSIVVGTTTISSGTNGAVFYDNSGVLGNTSLTAGTGIALSGTANATISTNLSAGAGISITGTSPQTLAVSLSFLSNSLGANVTLNTSTYTDGPSVAQGSTGTWFASGHVTISNAAGASNPKCKLWDGTTVVDSGAVGINSTIIGQMALSGVISSPAGNIRISCLASASGDTVLFNQSGNSKDATINVHRIQ